MTFLRAVSEYPTIAALRPSGANAISRAVNGKGAKKYLVCSDGIDRRHEMIVATSATAKMPATNHPSLPLLEGAPAALVATTPLALPESHFISSMRSRAVCQRSSRSLAKHRHIAWSNAGGIIGLMLLMGGGSFSRIADATLS